MVQRYYFFVILTTNKCIFILYCLRFAVTLNKLRCISTIKIKKSLF